MSIDINALGLTREAVERSLVSAGDSARLARVMHKAREGGDVCVACIGGSITEGAYASDRDRNCYAALVGQWWRESFPNASIEFHNAGIGGTQSILGVHRVERDVLKYDPDFVIVEFAVNDHPDDWETEAYSNLCRRILTWRTNPAVLLLFTTDHCYINTQETEITVGSHYGLPMISQRDALRPELEAGRIKWDDIAKDWVHPNDRGHAIIASLVIDRLQAVLDGLDSIPAEEKPLPGVFISDRYANARLYTYDDVTPESFGSFTFKQEEERFWLAYKKYWHCEGGEEPLVFKVRGSRVFLMYDGGTTDKHKVSFSVDGEPKKRIEHTTLDAGSAALYRVYDGADGEHEIAVWCDEGVFDMKGLLVS
ncbi:MAG: SGNH/GDSL hydrolase family protein [Clostridia bacterium]|nr:SGNH/GDSL hydrolase family protein [Clostridia bacterium]